MSRDDFVIGSTMFIDNKASLHIQILARTMLHDPFSSVQLQIFLSLLGYPCATASVHLWFSIFSFAYQRRFILSHHRGVWVVRCACTFLWQLSQVHRQRAGVGGEEAGSSQGKHGTAWEVDRGVGG
jgi:hypothetical protein